MTFILVVKYTASMGECKGGKTPKARTVEYTDRNCKDRCNITPNCTGYELSNIADACGTITSEGATGDGDMFVTCFMKQTGIY